MKTLRTLLLMVCCVSGFLMPAPQADQIIPDEEICDCYRTHTRPGRWTIAPETGMKIWIPPVKERVKHPCANNFLLYYRKNIS
jgi:hypothetical protein